MTRAGWTVYMVTRHAIKDIAEMIDCEQEKQFKRARVEGKCDEEVGSMSEKNVENFMWP